MALYKVNQFPLFSVQVHIYLGGSSYKCEIKAPNTDDWNSIYLLEMCEQAIICVFLIISILQGSGCMSVEHASCGVQIQWRALGERMQFSVSGETAEKNDSHRPGVLQIVMIATITVSATIY